MVCWQTYSRSLICPKDFSEWAASSLEDGDDSSVDADADGDHVANLLEFAFGMDPESLTRQTSRASQDFSGQNVALTYHVDRAAGGVIVRVEFVELLGQEEGYFWPHSPHSRNIGNRGHRETRRILCQLTEDCLFACCC